MHLLRKELSELINKQMLIGLSVSFVLIIVLGVLMTSTITGEWTESGTVHIIDNDRTAFTQSISDDLSERGYTVETAEDFETAVREKGWKDAVLLPEGMTETLLERHEACQLATYTALHSTATTAMLSSGGSASIVTSAIEDLLSEEYLQGELAFLSDPVELTPYTYANGVTVQEDSTAIIQSLALFDQLMPLALFLLVVLTAQTIITAIATEKTDKTLETLLSAPVPRSSVIGAKMAAALIVALIYAVTYALGFLTAMLLTVSGRVDAGNSGIGAAFTGLVSIRNATEQLGLQIPAYGWLGVLAQLALTLGIALTASIILGGLVEDAKSAQTASMPVMLLTMFPYILSMVSDIRSMEGGAKWLLYLIPFTHTFTATGNLRFHDSITFWGGLLYQAVFLTGMTFAALKMYSSDILFVHGIKKKADTEKQ